MAIVMKVIAITMIGKKVWIAGICILKELQPQSYPQSLYRNKGCMSTESQRFEFLLYPINEDVNLLGYLILFRTESIFPQGLHMSGGVICHPQEIDPTEIPLRMSYVYMNFLPNFRKKPSAT